MASLQPRRRRRHRTGSRGILGRLFLIIAGLVILMSSALTAVRIWPEAFFRIVERMPRKEQAFADDVEFFKYGSIGNEARDGIPYKIWAVLPSVCSTLAGPDGYKSFGFVYEPGKDIPIGMSKVSVGGIEQLAINCSVCHVQRYRLAPDGAEQIFAGGAANTLDAQRYQRFLFDCAASGRFAPAEVLRAVKQQFPETGFLEQQMLGFIVPIARDAIGDLASRYAWTWRRPTWGPGRVDPFNPVKFSYLKQPIDDTIGNSDMMPIWNAALKESLQKSGAPTNWHWDGLSQDLREVIINSALGDGMTLRGYEAETIDRLYRYLQGLKSPKVPFSPDPALLARGNALFEASCASCHAHDGERVMTLIPAAEIGTDKHRLDMWTEAAMTAYNLYDKDTLSMWGRPAYPWTLDRFRNAEAYLAQPLDGIWLTGPYLHNGSVPTLDDLLKPARERPAAYVRGSEVLDFTKGGYVSPPCLPGTYPETGFCYDTALPGNSNRGHEYGTLLTEPDRRALVAYLLSL